MAERGCGSLCVSGVCKKELTLLQILIIKPRRKIIPYNPILKKIARQLRNDSTKSEIILWKHLKGKKMMGYDFHRQKPLDNFIVDFYCQELMLAIELDGYSHQLEEVMNKDVLKEIKLNEVGVKVLRFQDKEVYYSINNVISAIEAYVLEFEGTHPRHH